MEEGNVCRIARVHDPDGPWRATTAPGWPADGGPGSVNSSAEVGWPRNGSKWWCQGAAVIPLTGRIGRVAGPASQVPLAFGPPAGSFKDVELDTFLGRAVPGSARGGTFGNSPLLMSG